MYDGKVTLRIQVKQEWLPTDANNGGSKIERRRCFADAPFLVENSDAHDAL